MFYFVFFDNVSNKYRKTTEINFLKEHNFKIITAFDNEDYAIQLCSYLNNGREYNNYFKDFLKHISFANYFLKHILKIRKHGEKFFDIDFKNCWLNWYDDNFRIMLMDYCVERI